MGEWDDLVKALDDFIKWGDYFFEEERKTKEEPEEEPEMETKWEYAEDSDFEEPPKKKFMKGSSNVYLFKAKVVGGWMMRMYVRPIWYSASDEQFHERVLKELNSGNEWPDYRSNSLRGKWFLSDDSYVNEKL